MRLGRRTSILLTILLVIFIALIVYFGRFVFPAQMMEFAANFIMEKTGYDVTIGGITYLPLTQYYLKDVVLYDMGTPQKELVKIEGLSFSLKLWPFIRGKRVIASLGLSNLMYGGMRLNGFSSLYFKDLRSTARRPFLKNMDGVITLKNFTLTADALSLDIKDINGSVIFEDDTVKLTKTSFRHNGVTYNVECALTELDIDQPEATLSLTSDGLSAQGDFLFKEDYATIKRFSGKILNSPFNIKGDVKDISSPTGNLYCEVRADLEDIRRYLSRSGRAQVSLKPTGQCIIAAFYNGSLKELADAEGRIKLSSKNIAVNNIAIDEFYLDLRMDRGVISTHRFSARLYEGLFNGSLKVDLLEKGRPFSIGYALKDSDLKMLSKDLDLKKKDIAGSLSSKLFLKGYLNSPDSLRGSGWITITDGRLWESPLLGGVIELLRAPMLKSVVFEEAAGNIVVENKKVSTDDLTFYSESVNIRAKGSVGFDQNLDFVLSTNMTQDLVEGSSDFSRVANILLKQAGNYMGSIKVSGTIKNPKYKLDVKPVRKIFGNQLKGLLQNILE
jgi:hypothetical protein